MHPKGLEDASGSLQGLAKSVSRHLQGLKDALGDAKRKSLKESKENAIAKKKEQRTLVTQWWKVGPADAVVTWKAGNAPNKLVI